MITCSAERLTMTLIIAAAHCKRARTQGLTVDCLLTWRSSPGSLEKMEKVKEKAEKAKESLREKDMEVTAAEEEKEEDAVAEKEEEKVEKEKASTLDK